MYGNMSHYARQDGYALSTTNHGLADYTTSSTSYNTHPSDLEDSVINAYSSMEVSSQYDVRMMDNQYIPDTPMKSSPMGQDYGIEQMLKHQHRYINGMAMESASTETDITGRLPGDILRSAAYGMSLGYRLQGEERCDYRKHIPETRTHLDFIDVRRDDSPANVNHGEIIAHIEEIFLAVTGEDIPGDIEVNILDEMRFDRYSERLNLSPNKNIKGFAMHSMDICTPRKVFLREGTLAEVLTVAGHEIGHVIAERKSNVHDEEAKAIAFEYAWVKTIREFDMASIGHIVRNFPLARNGVHDIAQMFIENKMRYGENPLDLFDEIVADDITVAQMASHIIPSA